MAGASKFHEIWIEQCDAAQSIRERYGLRAAFDYLVLEKLLNFSEAATKHPAFALELPRFVSEVRNIFSMEELHSEIDRFEREQRDRGIEAAPINEGDEFLGPNPEFEIVRAHRFAVIKSLLTAAQLGPS